jgi:hypothetical protein
MISETHVTDAWQACAQASPAEAQAGMAKLGRQQPALLAYVLAASETLSPAAGELLVYIFFVISHMFYASGTKVRRVSPANIGKHETAIETQLSALQGSHEAFVERAALVLSSRQPHVFRYAVEAIIEAPSSAVDPVPLTPEEQGTIFLALAIAITALDESGHSEPRR